MAERAIVFAGHDPKWLFSVAVEKKFNTWLISFSLFLVEKAKHIWVMCIDLSIDLKTI